MGDSAAALAPSRGAERVAQASRTERLAWLDALRGIAALFVVFDHLSYRVLEPARHAVYQWFDPGQYGVFVFFLVSGYIVPASLERTGCVRRFWTSRIFRLYPLYLLAIAGAFALNGLGVGSLRNADQHPFTSVLGHLLMLQDLLGVPNVIDVVWTLSYEMVFYLLLTALLISGLQQRSARFALVFAGAALAAGGLLPTVALSRGPLGPQAVAAIADGLVVGGLVLAVTPWRATRAAGALLAGGTALALLSFNGRVDPWEGFTILALMFTGTVMRRFERGDMRRLATVGIAVAVFALAIVAGVWHAQASALAADAQVVAQRRWFSDLALAGATFVVGMALRRRRVPGPLAWLGLVSYSVYLLHPLLIEVYGGISWTQRAYPLAIQLSLAAGFLAVLLGCSALAYRAVEEPMQRLGRRLASMMEARWGTAAPGLKSSSPGLRTPSPDPGEARLVPTTRQPI